MHEPVKVLIVDDEPLIRHTMQAYFEDGGYLVLEASDGREGLSVYIAERPDIVFTDLRMPVMDGLSFITALRKLSSDVPIVVISGAGAIGDAIEAIRRGAWDYVTKPVPQLECLEIITRRSLERARLIAENNAYREQLEEMVRQRTAELRDSETRFRTLFESANDAIVLIHDDRVVTCNRKALELFGCSRAEILHRMLLSFSPVRQSDGSSSAERMRTLSRNTLDGEPQRYEWQLVRLNGEPFEAEISLNRLELLGTYYLQAIIRDITIHKEYERQLRLQAHYDSLTGLPNRFLLAERIGEALDAAKGPETIYLLLIGVDKFKHINDTLGHLQGDRLLCHLAGRLRQAARPGDTPARFVGDEFAMLLCSRDTIEEATDYARSLQKRLAEPMSLGLTELFVTVSIGLDSNRNGGVTAETLLRNAEAAMFQAKKLAGEHILVFTKELEELANRRFSLGNRLHKAIERDEFVLYYQPQFELATRTLASSEALLRWQPPGGEIVPPDQFVPLLEETGMIMTVGEWVLYRACSQLREWIDAGLSPLPVSVNISAWQFHGGRLPELVRHVLDECRIDPSLLCLELTESVVMHDIEDTIRTLHELTDMEVSLSIDDFGTGYSSLNYLRRMPIHELKIDRSFVTSIPHDGNSVAIVSTILGMASSMNLWVVAEGVESEEQLRFLSNHQCGKGQGYLLGRPLSAASFRQCVENGQRRTFRPPAPAGPSGTS